MRDQIGKRTIVYREVPFENPVPTLFTDRVIRAGRPLDQLSQVADNFCSS